MNKNAGAVPAAAPAASLLALMTAELDELEPEALRTSALKEIGAHGFTPAIAERLDAVFTLKVVRLLRSAHSSRTDFQATDALISAIARDRFRRALDDMPERFHARWKTLRDAMTLAQKLTEFAESVRDHVTDAGSSSWEIVADLVVKAGSAGVAWARIAEVLGASEAGPRSKSGVSQLLTSMQSKGWIESVSRGRTKSFYAGRNLHLSNAWKRVHGERPTDNVVEQAATAQLAATQAAVVASAARRIGCLNQGAVLEFGYLARERHRHVKEALQDLREVAAPKRAQARRALASSVADLAGFLNTRFNEVALQNFELLREHFGERGASVAPRFCIKGGWNPVVDDPLSIASIIRDTQDDGSEEQVCATAANTGFMRVVETGKYYLNNDIARDAIRKLYRNPRLSEAALDQLRQQIDLDDLLTGRGLTAESWLNCWLDKDHAANPRRFYRSTVIIPMTLQNNNLSQEFMSLLGERVASFRGEGYDRAILGFLCFDHPEAGYFHRSLDVEIGYLAADLMSMCLFVSVAFTALSKSYREAVREVSQNSEGLAPEPPRMGRIVWHGDPHLEIRESRKNLVLNMAISNVWSNVWSGEPASGQIIHATSAASDHVFTRMIDGQVFVGANSASPSAATKRAINRRTVAQRAAR